MTAQNFANDMASSWRDAGRRAPSTPSQGRSSCVAPGCPGLVFAEIKTGEGQQGLCLKHFEAVQAMVVQS